jgi:2-keto-4-pentenoate hydratase
MWGSRENRAGRADAAGILGGRMGARDHDAPDVGPVSSRNYNAEVRAGAACYQPEATAAARYGRRERRGGVSLRRGMIISRRCF